MTSDEKPQARPEAEQDLELDDGTAEAVRGGAGGDDPTEGVSLNFGHVKQ